MTTAQPTNHKRTYETICITKVDMPEEKYAALVERCKTAITQEGQGEWLYTDDWGRAKIAYTIGKDNRGRWTYFRYRSLAAGIDEVKRSLGINEFVLRSITTRAQDDGSDYEPIRVNMAQDLLDREKVRDWKEERNFRRGGGGYGGGGGGGYGGGGGGGGYGRRDYGDDDRGGHSHHVVAPTVGDDLADEGEGGTDLA